jgi:glutathione peroxidase
MVDRRALLAALMATPAAAAPAAWDFSLTRLEGGTMPLAEFRGRALLVVNTASMCGFTPQYEALQRLHDQLEPRGLTVLGVPSNDFNQEHTDARRVREFCDTMFGITFPMAGLTRVRGPQADPFFAWLAARGGGAPAWNFHKFLVSRDGARVQGFATRVRPDDPALLRAIEAALATA